MKSAPVLFVVVTVTVPALHFLFTLNVCCVIPVCRLSFLALRSFCAVYVWHFSQAYRQKGRRVKGNGWASSSAVSVQISTVRLDRHFSPTMSRNLRRVTRCGRTGDITFVSTCTSKASWCGLSAGRCSTRLTERDGGARERATFTLNGREPALSKLDYSKRQYKHKPVRQGSLPTLRMLGSNFFPTKQWPILNESGPSKAAPVVQQLRFKRLSSGLSWILCAASSDTFFTCSGSFRARAAIFGNSLSK